MNIMLQLVDNYIIQLCDAKYNTVVPPHIR